MRSGSRSALAVNLLFFGGIAVLIAGVVLLKDRTALGACLAVAGFFVAVSGLVFSGPPAPDPKAAEREPSSDA